MLGLAAQRALFSDAGQLGIAQSRRIVGATVFDHRPKDTREFVSGSGHRRFGPELGLQPTEPISQPRLGAVQRLCRHAKGVGQTVLDFASVGGVGPPAGDPVIGGQPHSGGEMFRTCKLANFCAGFAQKGQTSLDANTFHGGQVNAELLAKLPAHRLLMGLVALFAGHRYRGCLPIFESVHSVGDLLITVGQEVLMKASGLQRLAQSEKVLLAPISSQRFRNFRLALLATIVAQAGESLRVALSGDDRLENRQAGDLGDGVVQLHVHLIE